MATLNQIIATNSNLQNREVLEPHFNTGEIPTQEHFYNLIHNPISRKDDGIFKSVDHPLSILATNNEVLHFYNDADKEPLWKINVLNKSLTYENAEGKHLTLDSSGKLGIGTTSPKRLLEIKQTTEIGAIRISSRHSAAYTDIGYGFSYNNAKRDNGFVINANAKGGTWGRITLHANNKRVLRLFSDRVLISSNVIINKNLTVKGITRINKSDFAELFESSGGKEIPEGTSVVFTRGGKIRAAKKDEVPFGIVTKNPGIVGNSYTEWPDKYLRDEFGHKLMEEVGEEEDPETLEELDELAETGISEEERSENGISDNTDMNEPMAKTKQKAMKPKINPKYDASIKYITREEREEWNIVGLVGQLRLKKGQPVAPNWVKIKDISDKVELWLVK